MKYLTLVIVNVFVVCESLFSYYYPKTHGYIISQFLKKFVFFVDPQRKYEYWVSEKWLLVVFLTFPHIQICDGLKNVFLQVHLKFDFSLPKNRKTRNPGFYKENKFSLSECVSVHIAGYQTNGPILIEYVMHVGLHLAYVSGLFFNVFKIFIFVMAKTTHQSSLWDIARMILRKCFAFWYTRKWNPFS